MKTRVSKHNGRWWVEYVLPYSGYLDADFETWNQAFAEALIIEQHRWHA